jgi:copper chaperone CopZ
MGMNVGLIIEGGAHLPHLIKHLSAIVLLFIFITGKYDFSKFFARFRTDSGDKMSKNIFKIKVPDMTCQQCKMKIDNALQSVPEIQSVSIDLNTKEVEVESVLDRQLVIKRIKEEGYHPV